jgi:hypothetical protein
VGKLSKYLREHIPSTPTKGARNPGLLIYSKENMRHVSWCLDNGICISVTPNWSTSTKWTIEVKLKGTVHADPLEYKDEAALRKMYEYYKYYYNKYNAN